MGHARVSRLCWLAGKSSTPSWTPGPTPATDGSTLARICTISQCVISAQEGTSWAIALSATEFSFVSQLPMGIACPMAS